MTTPFYNPHKSYEENYSKGPYGELARGKRYVNRDEPLYEFLGQKLNLPFGIPAGPILNSRFAKAAFDSGFDMVVYKTVRSGIYPCHPYPNVLPVTLKGNLTLERAKKPLIIKTRYQKPLSITNSFGVPSKDPLVWQTDVKKALNYAGKGQVLILSFMGTVKIKQTEKEFIKDFGHAALLAKETGAKILEVNLSCPNIGNEGLVCYNLKITEKALGMIRKKIGNTPLIVKTGYFADDKELLRFVEIVNKYANAISSINTIAAPVINESGKQALSGTSMRLKSGICGAAIRWAGIDMVKRLKKMREEKDMNFKIIGVGGVMEAEDYFEYIKAGADAVMSATGAMWNPRLAQQIKT